MVFRLCSRLTEREFYSGLDAVKDSVTERKSFVRIQKAVIIIVKELDSVDVAVDG